MPDICESFKNLARPATHCSRRILLYHPGCSCARGSLLSWLPTRWSVEHRPGLTKRSEVHASRLKPWPAVSYLRRAF